MTPFFAFVFKLMLGVLIGAVMLNVVIGTLGVPAHQFNENLLLPFGIMTVCVIATFGVIHDITTPKLKKKRKPRPIFMRFAFATICWFVMWVWIVFTSVSYNFLITHVGAVLDLAQFWWLPVGGSFLCWWGLWIWLLPPRRSPQPAVEQPHPPAPTLRDAIRFRPTSLGMPSPQVTPLTAYMDRLPPSLGQLIYEGVHGVPAVNSDCAPTETRPATVVPLAPLPTRGE